MFKIVRMYQRDSSRHMRRTIKSGLTLEQAQAHCQDPETSSSACRKAANVRRTKAYGDWFDGYEECRK